MISQLMKSMLWASLAGVILLIPGVSSAQSPDDILIIANKSAPESSMSLAELKQIFLKKKSSWSNGNKIVAINAQDNSQVRRDFRKLVLDMTDTEELTYWEKQKIKKQIGAPTELQSRTKAVFKLKNAISYAYRKEVQKDVVKVLLVIPVS